MKGWTGRPVLAMLSASQIPAVPATSALAGLRAGILSTLDAAPHDAAGERCFDEALLDARTGPDRDYEYSHQFAIGAEAAAALLHQISGGLS